jgi:hypothetical protein
MRTKKWSIIFLLFTGIILFSAQSAIGGCELPFLDELVDLSNAPKTKYEGPITVYFDTDDYPPAPISYLSDMYYFLRLRKGQTKYSFSGVTRGIDYRQAFIPQQLDALDEFFRTTVIKTIYNCNPDPDPAVGNCPDYSLKSYRLDVNEDESMGSSDFRFWIVDIIIGVLD